MALWQSVRGLAGKGGAKDEAEGQKRAEVVRRVRDAQRGLPIRLTVVGYCDRWKKEGGCGP